MMIMRVGSKKPCLYKGYFGYLVGLLLVTATMLWREYSNDYYCLEVVLDDNDDYCREVGGFAEEGDL